jgi:hypothetical protein
MKFLIITIALMGNLGLVQAQESRTDKEID